MKLKCLTAFLLLLFAALSAGCATTPQENQNISTSDEEEGSSIDPYESVNRPLYDFTDTIDRNVLAPVADTYIDWIPKPVRTSVGNFYDNLAYPNTIINSFLQGKMIQGTEDSLRLVVNSTIGLAGLFDVATPMGLKRHDEDFGQTLGVWGVDSTSYMYLPILGPTSNRDVYGIPFTMASNALFYAGFRPRATSSFCFGKKSQNHFRPGSALTGNFATRPNKMDRELAPLKQPSPEKSNLVSQRSRLQPGIPKKKFIGRI